MADIRILDAKFKDIIKRTDTSVDELIEAIKTIKKETLFNVTAGNVMKNCNELDLFLMSLYRKHKELRIKLLSMVNVGASARNEFEQLYNFERFMEYIIKSRLEYLERIRRKMSTSVMPHQFVIVENHLTFNFEPFAQSF